MVQVNPTETVESTPVQMEGAQGCSVRWLVGKPQGAPNFAMRQFSVAPGGHTPKHSHPYEHEVYILAGEGVVLEGDREIALKAGDAVFVTPDEVHQFRNTGDVPLQFLCMVPHVPEGTAVRVVSECGES